MKKKFILTKREWRKNKSTSNFHAVSCATPGTYSVSPNSGVAPEPQQILLKEHFYLRFRSSN